MSHKWQWWLDFILVPFSRSFWKYQSHREDKAFEWSDRNPEASTDDIVVKIFYGIPIEISKDTYEEAFEYADKKMREDDFSSGMTGYFTAEFIIKRVIKYYLNT